MKSLKHNLVFHILIAAVHRVLGKVNCHTYIELVQGSSREARKQREALNHHVFEVMDDEAEHLGIYTTLEKAKEALKFRGQINRVPLDRISHFGRKCDCVWERC